MKTFNVHVTTKDGTNSFKMIAKRAIDCISSVTAILSKDDNVPASTKIKVIPTIS